MIISILALLVAIGALLYVIVDFVDSVVERREQLNKDDDDGDYPPPGEFTRS